MKQLIILGVMTAAALVAVCFTYAVRRTPKRTFYAWMRAEGWTLLMFIWFTYGMILLWKGIIQ